MTAGSSVTAISTASDTVTAAARPMTVRNGICTTTSPTSAITTVAPANTTAPPAVAVACSGESARSPGVCGRRRRHLARLHAVVEVLAMTGQDEQRVVDADRQPEHRG